MFLKILQISHKNVFAGVNFLIKLQAGNLKLSEGATGIALLKKVFLKRCFKNQPFIYPLLKIGVFEQLTKLTAKYLCWSFFLIKLHFWAPATLLKNTPTQVLSREIYKLFKNNYFEEHLWNATSKHYLKRDSNTATFLWILWIIQEHLFSRVSTNG